MRRLDRIADVALWLAAIAVTFSGGLAWAQAAPATAPADDPAQRKLADQWNNLLHYIRLASEVPAESFGKAIVDSKPDPRALYRLASDTDRDGSVLARGKRIERLAPVIAQIQDLIDRGAQAVRQDPAEIRRWIDMLGGSARQVLNGTRRLMDSGEYAVPQLISRLGDRSTSALLRERIISVLPRLGKDGVRPLVEALQSTDAQVQEAAARALGQIGYPHAAAHLQELARRKGVVKPVADAARGALAACAGKQALDKPVAEMFHHLAEKYYRRDESVNPDSRYDTANVWFWENGRVTYRPVPRAIFNDIYTVIAARKALEHDQTFYPSVVLWLAADTRREVNLPAGATDPFRPAGTPDADYYLTASPPKYIQMALHRALKDGDVGVALRAVNALSKTVGARSLVSKIDELGGAQPLVAALMYPARVVRYTAAEALAKARPQKAFTGSHLVVPVLTEALRQTGTAAAALAAPDQTVRNTAKDLFRGLGYAVFDDATFGAALDAARKAGGGDLLALSSDISSPALAEALRTIRSDPLLDRLPVVVLAKPGDMILARGLAKKDPSLGVVAMEDIDAGKLKAGIPVSPGGAALPADQAVQWCIRAAQCLGMLAETHNPVYDLTGATKSLIAALTDSRAPVQIAAAQALAKFRGAEPQRALASLAGDGKAAKEVRLASYAAATDSVRQFGNELDEKQVDALIAVVTAQGDLDIRNAAATLLGSLNLPSEKVKELILSAP